MTTHLTDGTSKWGAPLGVANNIGTGFTPFVTTEGQRATYSAAILGLVAANSATDIFEIKGSATKTVRVLRVSMMGTATATAPADVQGLVRNTAANSGGTSTAPAAVPHDSLNAAATAALKAYTVNPAGLGTLVAVARVSKLILGTVGAPVADRLVWDFTTRNGQGIVLRGILQTFALNLNAATYAGNLLDIDIEWSEE